MFCPNCGAQLPDNAAFCGKCGRHLRAAAGVTQAAASADLGNESSDRIKCVYPLEPEGNAVGNALFSHPSSLDADERYESSQTASPSSQQETVVHPLPPENPVASTQIDSEPLFPPMSPAETAPSDAFNPMAIPQVKIKKTPIFVRFAILGIVWVVVGILIAVNYNSSNVNLKDAVDTTSTEFTVNGDYDLGKVIVWDGWKSYQSSSERATEYELFIIFEGRDNLCIGLLSVKPDDKTAYDAIDADLAGGNELSADLTLDVIATVRNMETDKRSQLDDRIDTVEDIFGVTCTPVYYSFEYVTDTKDTYEAEKVRHVNRRNDGYIAVGMGITVLLLINTGRAYVAIRREEVALQDAVREAAAPSA